MLNLVRSLLLILCVTPASFAQSDDAPDTLIVTASLTPLALADIASSVTVISREEIRYREARNAADLLRAVPGFALSQAGPAGTQMQLRVRGTEANHVLVLINGIEANDPAGGDEFRFELLAASDIERIEIVRGAQSALWGSEAIGGVINIITRSDAPGDQIDAFVEAGEASSFAAGVSAAGEVGDWALQGSVSRLQTDGFNIARVGDEDDGFERLTAALSASRQFGESGRFQAGLRHLDSQTDTDAIDFFTTGLPVDGDRRADAQRTYLDASLSWMLADDVTQQITASLVSHENDSLADGAPNGSTEGEELQLRAQTTWQFSTDTLSLVFHHERTDFEQSGLVSFGDPNQSQSVDTTGLAAEWIGQRFEDWTFSAGARFESNSDFDDLVSGRVGAVLRLSESTRLRASIGTGEKTPTFTERFGFFPDQFLGNPDLEPESSTAYELALEQEWLGGDLSLDFIVFKQALENEIDGFVFDPTTFLFTAANRDGDSRRQGAELIAQWRPIDSVQADFSYTYLDATEEQTGTGQVDELRRPRHSAHIGLTWQALSMPLVVTLNADYSGDRLDQFFPPFPTPSQIVTLDAYWLADVTASWELGQRATIYLRANNLLDEGYENVFGFQTADREVFAGLRLRFGEER